MSTSELRKPANVPKRTGIGCAVLGLVLFVPSVLALGIAVLTGLEYVVLVVFGSVLLVLSCISGLVGVGMFFQGLRVDRMLSGADLIASWRYPRAGAGEGFVYVGSRGLFHNGQYLEWSSKSVLDEIFVEEGEETVLVVKYSLLRNSAQSLSPHITKKLRIPVPDAHRSDAERVVAALD